MQLLVIQLPSKAVAHTCNLASDAYASSLNSDAQAYLDHPPEPVIIGLVGNQNWKTPAAGGPNATTPGNDQQAPRHQFEVTFRLSSLTTLPLDSRLVAGGGARFGSQVVLTRSRAIHSSMS